MFTSIKSFWQLDSNVPAPDPKDQLPGAHSELETTGYVPLHRGYLPEVVRSRRQSNPCPATVWHML
jgi:hypothetical protein